MNEHRSEDRPPSTVVETGAPKHLRLKVLLGLLLIAAAAYITYGPLPEPGEDREPALVEQWWFKYTQEPGEREPDVIFVPTPQSAVDRMVELADLKPGDKLYDLGCGDGRIVVTAAKRYGVQAVGVDIDPLRVAESRRNVKRNGVEDLVTILKADIFELDFSDASAVTLYLLPDLNYRLKPKLAQLKPGTRIISFEFDMAGAKPAEVVQVPSAFRDDDQGPPHRILKWVVPWEETPE